MCTASCGSVAFAPCLFFAGFPQNAHVVELQPPIATRGDAPCSLQDFLVLPMLVLQQSCDIALLRINAFAQGACDRQSLRCRAVEMCLGCASRAASLPAPDALASWANAACDAGCASQDGAAANCMVLVEVGCQSEARGIVSEGWCSSIRMPLGRRYLGRMLWAGAAVGHGVQGLRGICTQDHECVARSFGAHPHDGRLPRVVRHVCLSHMPFVHLELAPALQPIGRAADARRRINQGAGRLSLFQTDTPCTFEFGIVP